MSKKPKQNEVRTCGECIHEWAGAMWNVGTIHFANATSCSNYETVKMSAAYFIGKIDGEKSAKEGETNAV